MSTYTPVTRPANPSKKVTKAERRSYLGHFKALGWSQNEAARRIGREHGVFGRWLRGELQSAPMREAIDTLLGEHLRPASATNGHSDDREGMKG